MHYITLGKHRFKEKRGEQVAKYKLMNRCIYMCMYSKLEGGRGEGEPNTKSWQIGGLYILNSCREGNKVERGSKELKAILISLDCLLLLL